MVGKVEDKQKRSEYGRKTGDCESIGGRKGERETTPSKNYFTGQDIQKK